MRLFSDVADRVDDPFLAHAASLAARAFGRTWPNPIVGCVVVRDGVIVGEGFHHRAGEPHAEVLALRDAGTAARGAHAYVTLEPCAHHGKTPPCVDALLAAGVSRVDIGMRDPTTDASGGAARLAEAGVVVGFASDPRPFAELNSGWIKRLATGVPRVSVKVGTSLDARVAFALGERATMTGESGSGVTRRLRAHTDAVLVSAVTVQADDPALTVRTADGALATEQPLRVVLAHQTLPPRSARVFSDGAAETVLLASERADLSGWDSDSQSVRVVPWKAADGLAGALRALGWIGIGEVLVEAGPRLLSSLWTEDLIDELVCVTAGGMGGTAVPIFIGPPDREGSSLVHRMRPLEAGIIGDVAVTVWGATAPADLR
ncbi:MAG: bifunctional diaminohydroxyphosphoribosylaminopyrimidine deaminase/5-amino-6-(5-phosphoribosylamino)uracil reductase RibD [Coriobacteriia bacterium]|nr:bifunctional diaminohydroxyphosphoribosylaminopyrimidine deaminase/5-amino-6-(5-phosphoribosylamino)uracil reductase RibD [Coriobacteriia bacterium]